MIWNCCQNNFVVPGQDKRVLKGLFQEKFEDTKDIMINHKDRQCNSQKEYGRKTNNDLQNTTQKT